MWLIRGPMRQCHELQIGKFFGAPWAGLGPNLAYFVLRFGQDAISEPDAPAVFVGGLRASLADACHLHISSSAISCAVSVLDEEQTANKRKETESALFGPQHDTDYPKLVRTVTILWRNLGVVVLREMVLCTAQVKHVGCEFDDLLVSIFPGGTLLRAVLYCSTLEFQFWFVTSSV